MTPVSVIQGCFPRGLPHAIDAASTAQPFAGPARPAWVHARIGAHGAPQPIQRQTAPAARVVPLPPPAHHPHAVQLSPQLASSFAAHGGTPLPPQVRQKMEAAFGVSFGDVRLHVGPHVTALGATSFTQGSNIHFAPGHYNPHTHPGQETLGRELAHVVQQRTGRVRNPFGSGTAVIDEPALEAEAARVAFLAAAPVQRRAAASIQRLEPITVGLLGLAGLGALYATWRYCVGGGPVTPAARKSYAQLPAGRVPAHDGRRMNIPRGTRVYHGTPYRSSEWWKTSAPGLKNDEDGGVSFTLVPSSTPKVRNHDVIVEYEFKRDAIASVCASKAAFHGILTSGSKQIGYTAAEQEIKIRMQDGSYYLAYRDEYDGDPARPQRTLNLQTV
jgi:hypothetical protein